jgi:hypothetical protein
MRGRKTSGRKRVRRDYRTVWSVDMGDGTWKAGCGWCQASVAKGQKDAVLAAASSHTHRR